MIDPVSAWIAWRNHKKMLANAQFAHWYEWERVLLLVPKRDINGKLIFGKAWMRERYGSVLGEYDPATHVTRVYTVTDRAYATNKAVFIDKLKDKLQNDT